MRSPRPIPAARTGAHEAPGQAKAAWLMALAAGLVPLALFAFALHPGLPAGDSGELITVAATGGVAHPPGYPLYALLAGLWRVVFPFGSVAWRLNVFSAVCTAAAGAVMALAVRRVSGSALAGVFAAGGWAASPQAFQYALVAEVFPLNALLAACVLLAAVSTPARGGVVLAFLCALALSHHHTLLLLAVPAFTVTAVRALAPAATRARLAARMTGAGLVGLSPLLWLPFATHHAHALVWGEASTWRGFLALLTRAEYGSLRLDPAEAGLAASHAHLLLFARALPRSFGVMPLVLAVVGALRLVLTPRWRGTAIALAAWLAVQAWFFTRIGFPADVPWLMGVVERFYISMPRLSWRIRWT